MPTTAWVARSPIIQLLARIDPKLPAIDRDAAEAALRDHFDALRLPRPPVRWAVDAESGCYEGWRSALQQGKSGGSGAAVHQQWQQAINTVRTLTRCFRYPAREETMRYRIPQQAQEAAWQAAYSRRRAMLWSAEADDLALLAALGHEHGRALEPFARAFEAGLWLVWVTRAEIVAVPRPAVHLQDGRLHNSSGPAVEWEGGACYWFLHGVKVPSELVTMPPDQLDARLLLRESNAEVRKEVVRRIGLERICETLGAATVDREGSYELVLLNIQDGRRRPYLRMVNPSTLEIHLEGVPPDTRCVREAIAWRNQLFGAPERLT